jgi:hypothetical protein
VIDPAALQIVLGVLTGWLDRREREAVAYLVEENRFLRRQLRGRRPRLTDDDRRRLAAQARRVGRAALREIATIATPDRILGSTPHPEALFMEQLVRTLAMTGNAMAPAPHVLICDRDRKWSGDVRRRLHEAGVRVVVTPKRAPNANAYAERSCGLSKKNAWIG